MCLRRITKKYKENKTIVEGYKLFYFPYDDRSAAEFENFGGSVHTDKWMKRTRARVYYGRGGKKWYDAGFHIFKTKKAADAWGGDVVRVRGRGIMYEGIQNNNSAKADCYVVKELFVAQDALDNFADDEIDYEEAEY